MEKIDQFMFASIYAEFPDVLLSLELAVSFARIEKRSVEEALRHVARNRKDRIKNQHLRKTLTIMSGSIFPIEQMIDVKRCIERMKTELIKQFKADGISIDDAIEEVKKEMAILNK